MSRLRHYDPYDKGSVEEPENRRYSTYTPPVMMTGYWWENDSMGYTLTHLVIDGKDYHEMSLEEWYGH